MERTYICMKRIFFSGALLALVTVAAALGPGRIDHVFSFAQEQFHKTIAETPFDRYPRYTDPDDGLDDGIEYGHWILKGNGDWTAGFWPGCLWMPRRTIWDR